MQGKDVTQEQYDYIFANYETMKHRDIAKYLGLHHRTVTRILLRTGKRTNAVYFKWDEDKDKYLIDNYREKTFTEIGMHLDCKQHVIKARYLRLIEQGVIQPRSGDEAKKLKNLRINRRDETIQFAIKNKDRLTRRQMATRLNISMSYLSKILLMNNIKVCIRPMTNDVTREKEIVIKPEAKERIEKQIKVEQKQIETIKQHLDKVKPLKHTKPAPPPKVIHQYSTLSKETKCRLQCIKNGKVMFTFFISNLDNIDRYMTKYGNEYEYNII